MANHLTPDQLADQLRMDRQEVIGHCVETGIPILHGRIDKDLFVTSLRSPAPSGPGKGRANLAG